MGRSHMGARRARRGVAAALAALLACTAAGCAPSSENQVNVDGPAPPAEQPAAALTLFAPADDSSSSARHFRGLIDQFNDEHPDSRVVIDGVSTAEGYNTFLEERLDAGEGDDIFIVNADSVKALYAKGHFYDMSSFSVFQNLNEAARVQASIGDIGYCIPVSMNPYGMAVNLDVLARYDLDVPRNLEEFEACCATIKAKGEVPIALNRWYALTVPAMANGLWRLYGAADVQAQMTGLADGTVKVGDSMLEGFEVVQEFIERGWYGDGLDGATVDALKAGERDVPSFASGECAFYFLPARSYGKILAQNPEANFIVTGVPVEGGMVSLPALGSRLCLNAQGKNLEVACEFVEFVTEREMNEELDDDGGTFPVFKDQQATVDARLVELEEVYQTRPQIPIEDMSLPFTYWDTVRELCLRLFDGATAAEVAAAYNDIQAAAIAEAEGKPGA